MQFRNSTASTAIPHLICVQLIEDGRLPGIQIRIPNATARATHTSVDTDSRVRCRSINCKQQAEQAHPSNGVAT